MRIAFFGPPGSGKTALARELARRTGGQKLSFADPLRAMVCDRYDVDMAALTTVPEKYEWRSVLQEVGQEMRAEDPDYWVRAFDNLLRGYEEEGVRHFFIDDVRFPNEYEYCREQGFWMVRAKPDPTTKGEIAITDEERGDVSELHWPNFQADTEIRWINGVHRRARRMIWAWNWRGSTRAHYSS